MTSPAPYAKPTGSRRRLALTGAILAGLIATALVAASAFATTATTKSTHTPQLQEDLDALVAAGVPGAILVIRDGSRTVSLASGLGNVDEQTPMRPGDRFRIASHTKTYVATVVLQLVSEGKLRLEDTVEQWLPGLVPNGDGITIRQLLNHTEWSLRLRERPARLRALHKRRPRLPLGAPGARPDRRFARASVRARRHAVVLEYGLHPCRTNHQGGDREHASWRAEPAHLPAPRPARDVVSDQAGIAGRHAHGYIILGEPPAIDITGISPFVCAAGATSRRVRTT